MITENYIKMCEQAEEIQKLKKGKNQFSNQDFVAYNFGQGLKFYICNEINRYWTIQDLIWLPTLEQLIEMAHKARNKNAHYKSKEYEIIADFIDWMLNSDINKYKDFNLDFNDTKSCLLIYIMEEFYNKIWTGEKWEEITC